MLLPVVAAGGVGCFLWWWRRRFGGDNGIRRCFHRFIFFLLGVVCCFFLTVKSRPHTHTVAVRCDLLLSRGVIFPKLVGVHGFFAYSVVLTFAAHSQFFRLCC